VVLAAWAAGSVAEDGPADPSELTGLLAACFLAAGVLAGSGGASAAGAFFADSVLAGPPVSPVGLLSVEVAAAVSSGFMFLLHPPATTNNSATINNSKDIAKTAD
jgi:hypothetical protein